MPIPSRGAVQLFISKNWPRRQAHKAEVEKEVTASELQSKRYWDVYGVSEFTSRRERRIGYLISLYRGIEAVVHRISGTPCKQAPPLPSKLPKQQCSPVIGILQLTFPAPPIEGFLCYRGVCTKLLSIPSEYKKVGIWCWTRRAFVS